MQEQLEQYVDYAAREIAEICQKVSFPHYQSTVM